MAIREASEITPLCSEHDPQNLFLLSLPNDFITAYSVPVDTPWNPNLSLVQISELALGLNRSIRKVYVLLPLARKGLSQMEGRLAFGGIVHVEAYIEYKQTIFCIIHQLRLLCDTIITACSLRLFKLNIINDDSIKVSDIGSLLNSNVR